MPWFLSHFQRLNRRERVKPGSEDQLVSGDLSNLRVASLEGVRELQSLNAHSDKTALKRRFDHKQLISPVRTHNAVTQYPPRAGTVVPSLAPDLRQSS
jgi:hypothetical protein